MSPDERAALFQQATEAQQGDRPDAAQRLYEQVLAANPDDAEALLNLGMLAANAGDPQAGIALVRRSLRLVPRHPVALRTLVAMALGLHRFDEALSACNRLLAATPADAALLVDRTRALCGLERDEEALDSAGQALQAAPDSADAHWAMAMALSALARPVEAIAHADAAAALKQDHAPALFCAALEWLRLGDYARGWPLYEWRFLAHPGGPERIIGRPQWFHADPLEGKRILLHAEQGFGDSLQFCRYAPLLAARGAHVVLEVPAPLVGLMRRLPGVAEVFATGDVLPDVHTHAPLLTLPLEFGTTPATIPAEVPYLHADPARMAAWAARLGPRRGARIGLAWSGNPQAGRKRHVPLAALAPLLALEADFIALQTEIPPADRAAIAAHPRLRHFADEIGDFDDTAALIAQCDLVVTVDTAVAHLAGAMGARSLVMLAHAADWRWLQDRDDSPWYPTARLFRQPVRGDWASVVAGVTEAVAATVGAHPAGLHAQGVQVANDGDLEAGMALLRRSLRQAPGDILALWNLGTMAMSVRRYEEALGCFNRLMANDPGNIPQMASRAAALNGLYRHAEALESCDIVLARHPGHPNALVGRGNALYGLEREAEAEASFREAVALHPDQAEAQFGLGIVLLAQGRLAEGWPQYEWRDQANPRRDRRAFAMPRWAPGDRLQGRRILVHAEQGLGDTLQFCRHLALLAEAGAEVVAEVQAPLVGLLARSLPVPVLAIGAAQGRFDAHLPAGSLPLALGTTLETLPAAVPYLRADPDRVAQWAARLGQRARPRVGLAWSGNAFTGRKRHLPLAALAPLLALDAEFIALQVEIPPADSAVLESTDNLRAFAGTIVDFDDTAALAALCDLVITVDTATAHLAGAMGRPTWIMLARAPDWRWLRGRDDSPWYPTARLFRQAPPGRWQDVVQRITRDFADQSR